MRSSAARLLLSKGSKHEVGRQVCLCLQSLCNRQPPSPREMHPEWGDVQGLTLLLMVFLITAFLVGVICWYRKKYAKDLISRLLKVNPEERNSVVEIMKHPWLQDSQVIRRATALMNTQVKGRKRLVEEVDGDEIPDKRSRVGEAVSVFRTPQLGTRCIFNPPS